MSLEVRSLLSNTEAAVSAEEGEGLVGLDEEADTGSRGPLRVVTTILEIRLLERLGLLGLV